MNLYIKIIIVLVLLIIGQYFYSDYVSLRTESENVELRNRIVLNERVIKEYDSSYSKLSFEYTSNKELFDKLKNENSSLAKDIKKRDEEIERLRIAVINVDTVYITTTEVIVRDSIAQFVGYKRPFTVNGAMDIKNQKMNQLSVMTDPFKLILLDTKTDSGFYKFRVKFLDIDGDVLDVFRVTDIQSSVKIESCDETFMRVGVGGSMSLNQLSPGITFTVGGKNTFVINYNLIKGDNKDIESRFNIGYYRMLW